MCAIAGYLLTGGRETSSRRLRAALEAMRHRGPDDEGLALFDPRSGASQRLVTANSDPGVEGCDTAGDAAELAHGVAFGHGRFSIIDPGPEGHQPFWSSDGAVCAAFNGEIYNYVEVRRELEGLGRRFRTASDTEVLVAAYEEWGSACFPRLNGFWALCLWDARRRQVMLARDRIGKAPLYVWSDGSGLYWASELKGLFALNGRAAKKVNAGAVADFVKFQRRDIHGETCYEGVTSFPRASWAWVEPGSSYRAEPYWTLPDRRLSSAQISVEDASDGVEGLLRDAVRIRLRADVPVCVQLSGGMDSSSAMALAAQEADKINVYTVKFAEKDADEEPFARVAASRYLDKVEYNVITPPDDDLLEHMDSYVYLMGEPFHSPNQFTSQRIWRQMHARGQRVVLYGAGGDEVFAGYVDDYYLPFLRHLARNGEVVRCLRELFLSSESSTGRHLAQTARRLGRRVPGLRLLLDPGSRLSPGDDAFRLPPGVTPRQGPADDIEGLLRDNMTDWRMNYWVRIDNQNSMGVPVELRCPFLDHRLVEYAFRLPLEYLIHDGWLKWILRRAMAGHLPPEIVWRRRKMGFPFPLPSWLRQGKGRILSMLASLDCPFIDSRLLRERYDEMAARNPRRLWCILSVALWWKRCVQGQPLLAGP